MTFRQRIRLDRLLAVPLCLVCDLLARGISRILRRDHSIVPATTRHVVVSKLVGIGSVIQATPLLRSLKQNFPQARLTLVTLKANRPLADRLEGVDEVVCLDDSNAVAMLWTTANALANLIAKRVDHYFDLELYSGFACLLSLFSLARNRFGFYRHSNRFKKGIYTHLVYFNTRMPVRKIYLQLGRVAGIPTGAEDQLGALRIERSERASLKKKLTDLGLAARQPYILINPNASDLLIERRWPEGHAVAAMTRLTQLGHSVVLLGANSEAAFVQNLVERVPAAVRGQIVNTAGQLTLGEAFALIDGAACVLTNDTGPMHMAFALGRPTVCLFGPADPIHYGLNQPNIVTLYAPVPCSPCLYEVDEPPCRGQNICMQRLSPELVVNHVLALLARSGCKIPGAQSSSTSLPDSLPLIWDNEGGQPLGIALRP